ncbi:N-terminal amidase Nta1 [Schizosaccharomyces japonicus yFS275]|uniref:N-terminal amidase Nta1 n=1 Tax=Schizosaccharomyces japonicus (strain yFS275 / FY16936) TaxID=402676 RepID=B6JVR1_SCHJY|nr:N-terminal amidase Nta1 [Schizosaccharomyces japonicus yFS275]EEB05462.1 N-terminal amidase Nta1 [Schizosaccharomyces japonicus yFS275]
MRIACVQFCPEFGKVHKNVERLNKLLSNYSTALGKTDLIVFPEMALTGYNFRSKAEILPFAESRDRFDGASLKFAKTISRLFSCHTIIGFPEIIKNCDKNAQLYNSTALLGPDGDLLHVYHKHFLYETDKSWAIPGDAFHMYNVDGLGPISMAICMDINPFDFKASFDEFEYANFVKSRLSTLSQRPVLCLSMSWLASENDKNLLQQNGPDITNINYWATRLSPLIEKDVVIAIANRTGEERGITFAGTSCIMTFAKGKVNVHGLLGMKEDGVTFADIKE